MSSEEPTKSSHGIVEPSNASLDKLSHGNDPTPLNVGFFPHISAVHLPNNVNYVFYYNTGGTLIHYLKGQGDDYRNYTEETIVISNTAVPGSNRPLVAVLRNVSEIRFYYIDRQDRIQELVLDIVRNVWSRGEFPSTRADLAVAATSGLFANAGPGVIPASTPARLFFVRRDFPGEITTATFALASNWTVHLLGPRTSPN